MLVRVEGRDIDVDESNARVLERRAGGRCEVAVACADADYEVGLSGESVRCGGAGCADRTKVLRVVPDQGSAAGLGGGNRDAGLLGKGSQLLLGSRVDHATAGDDERRPGRPQCLNCPGERAVLGERPTNVPFPILQERQRNVEAFGLHIFRKGDRDGTCLSRVKQNAHGAEGDGEELLRSLHPVKELGEGAKSVVDGEADIPGLLKLLQYRIGDSGGKCVARKQERGQPVGGGEGRSGQHVRCPGPDRCCGRESRPAAVHPRIADRLVNHGLLVAGLVIRHQIGRIDVCLLERLPNARDVSMTEDAEHPRNGALADRAIHCPLVSQKLNQCLGDCHLLGRGHEFWPFASVE